MSEKKSIVLSPEQLELFSKVDPALPLLVTQAGIITQTQQYRYALTGLFLGLTAFLVLVAGFIYLVMNGHETPEAILLGTGVLGLVTSFLTARLNK